MKSATQILRDEHDAILLMLDALEGVARRLESGDAIALQTLTDFHEFATLFADRCHHGKEEDLLFPFLERKGVPRAGGPLGCMLTEHDEGRGYVRLMGMNAEPCASGDAAARIAWIGAARGYANLLRNHIWKENEILFRIAERVMSPEEQEALAKEFAKVEEEKIGQETHARLEEKLAKLTREMAATAH
ncbi:MAG TPA: hemerythrin domain-containing protein [Candidatus Limnocylindrales bacterium]|nr:hemerythrin domain-containing protein [Candidatus Limnocylindrales bacterium]